MIVTDGDDTYSKTDSHKALEAAQLSDAVIYPVVVVPITNDAGRNIGGEHVLAYMAEGTGGRVFMPTLGPALNKAFSDIVIGAAHAVHAGLLPARRAASQGPLSQAGSAAEGPGIAGIGAQRLLWGSRGRRRPGGRPRIGGLRNDQRLPRRARSRKQER